MKRLKKINVNKIEFCLNDRLTNFFFFKIIYMKENYLKSYPL